VPPEFLRDQAPLARHLNPGRPTSRPKKILPTPRTWPRGPARRAAALAAGLPALDLDAENLNALAGEVQRVNARLGEAEERLAFAGPAAVSGPQT